MLQFGLTLKNLMQRRDRSLEDIALVCGLSRPTLSKITTGDRQGVSMDNVSAIISAFERDEDKLSLLLAHLRDEIPEHLRGMVQIGPRDLTLSECTYTDAGDSGFEAAVRTIRGLIPRNPDLRQCLIDLAKACARWQDSRCVKGIRYS